MTRYIMLSFMSPYKDIYRGNNKSIYYGPAGFTTEGIQTNEPALLYVRSLYSLDKYYFFCSRKVQETLFFDSIKGKISHVDYFSCRMGEQYKDIPLIMEPLLYEEETFTDESLYSGHDSNYTRGRSDILAVQMMAETVKKYALPIIDSGEKVVMHIDMTGGFRHTSMLMLAVVSLLRYSGISIGKVLYTNYEITNKIGKIEEISETHDIMQLIAGAEAFVTYGSVTVLEKYFENKDISIELRNLLLAMRGFSDSLKLCRTGTIIGQINRLSKEIESYQNLNTSSIEENLFKQLLDRIKCEYAAVMKENDRLEIILWCLNKGFLQQALTFYTEWVPSIIVSSGILVPGEKNVKDECEKEAPDYVSWEKYLMINYNNSAVSAKICIKKCIKILKEFFRTNNNEYKIIAMDLLKKAGIDAEKVFFELSLNNQVVKGLTDQQYSISDIQHMYPSLYYIVDKFHNGNPNSPPRKSLEVSWCENLNQSELNKRLSECNNKWLIELFGIKTIDEKNETIVCDCFEDYEKYSRAFDRTMTMKSLLNRGFVKTEVACKEPKDVLRIIYEYNVVRVIRNNCNHALENGDIPTVDEIEEKLSCYIENIRSLKANQMLPGREK